MTTLTAANREWSKRNDDERFTSLTSLNDHFRDLRSVSAEQRASLKGITAVPDLETGGLHFVAGQNVPAVMTNHAFGQTARAIAAGTGAFPLSFIQTLPAPLAADVINHSIQSMDDESAKQQFLVSKIDDGLQIRAVTSPTYGRIWNHQISEALVSRFGDGRTGDFRVPGEFGKQVPITKRNTTIYGSDRDMFVFLCDEEHKIEVANRRDGQPGMLSRGFFVWNSEVGDTTLGVASFLFDYVCSNRLVWGATEYREIKMRHSMKAPERFLDEVSPMLTAMVNEKASGTESVLALAQSTKVGTAATRDDDLAKFFTQHLNIAPRVTKTINNAHKEAEGRPMETLWDISTGITEYAKSIPFQNDRVAMERKAGLVLDLVPNAA